MIKQALRCCPMGLVVMPAAVPLLALLGEQDRAWKWIKLLAFPLQDSNVLVQLARLSEAFESRASLTAGMYQELRTTGLG